MRKKYTYHMPRSFGMETSSVTSIGTSGFWVQAFSVLLCAYFSKISMKFMRNYITRAWTGGRDYCYVEPNLPEKKEGMVLNMLGGLHFQYSPNSERCLLIFAMLPERMILVVCIILQLMWVIVLCKSSNYLTKFFFIIFFQGRLCMYAVQRR